LTLRAKPQSGEIASTGLIDLFGNRTEISFREPKLNLDPPAETFSFEPPSDVQVIDLTPGR
jgi:outer membrane lipoprotein-sorting protein